MTSSEPLPSNSWVTIDNLTINANAGVVLLWERVLQAAITKGDARWVRLRSEEGIHSVLVTPASNISTLISEADYGEDGTTQLKDEPHSSLPALINEYIARDSDTWRLVSAMGFDKEIETIDSAR